jgi:hypothetical protein
MSNAARHNALSRHPALNRMPRDFLSGVAATPTTSPYILTGERQ